jgi:hypothetical protein
MVSEVHFVADQRHRSKSSVFPHAWTPEFGRKVHQLFSSERQAYIMPSKNYTHNFQTPTFLRENWGKKSAKTSQVNTVLQILLIEGSVSIRTQGCHFLQHKPQITPT